jgi:hypothetical protein
MLVVRRFHKLVARAGWLQDRARLMVMQEATMTEFELFDASDEPAASDDFDNAELVHWASHGQHPDPIDPGPEDEMSVAHGEDDPRAYGQWIADVERPASSDVDATTNHLNAGQSPDEDGGQTAATPRDGHSSNWIRVESPWSADNVDPYVTG